MRFHEIIKTPRRKWLEEHDVPEPQRTWLAKIVNKTHALALAKHLGLATPMTYVANVPLSRAIQVARTCDPRLVVKPTRAKAGWGVRTLVREGLDVFREILDGREFSTKALHRHLANEMRNKGFPNAWTVEELLLPPDGSLAPVEDIKVYAFFGNVELILHKKNVSVNGRRRGLFKWYGPDFREIRTGKYDDKWAADLQPPHDAERLVAAARSASSRLLFPFMRIDLYSTSRGVVFGEFTPQPGTPEAFNAETSHRLAAAWLDAERRLKEHLRNCMSQL